MNGKKLSRLQFHFPGLLDRNFPNVKTRNEIFFIIEPQRYSYLSVWVSRWTGPRIFFELLSKVAFFIVV